MFVVNEDMLQWISHAIAIAGAQYTEYMHGKNEDKILTERVEQFQQDYLELSDFAESLWSVGLILNVEDMLYLMKYPDKYSQYYLLWLELSRPINEDDETFELYKKEAYVNLTGVDMVNQLMSFSPSYFYDKYRYIADEICDNLGYEKTLSLWFGKKNNKKIPLFEEWLKHENRN